MGFYKERDDAVGLFWNDEQRERRARIRAPAQPVLLKPYTPRPLLQYEVATREELIAGAGGSLVFDTESFSNYFLIAFKDIATKKVTTLSINQFAEPDFNNQKLKWIMQNYRCIGFMSTKYDLLMVWLAYSNPDTETLKEASNDIVGGMQPGDVISKYNIHVRETDHIDLVEVCPLRGSLKLYGARLHAKRIQDLPWSDKQTLEDWQVPITENYCINDLDNTELLFDNLKEQMQLRYDLTAEYKQDLRSKSDAQIAEAVITSELHRLTRKHALKPRLQYNKVYKFFVPDNLYFQSDYMNNVLETVAKADFQVDDNGRLIRPDEIKKLEIKLGRSIYRMGIGGLHSSEKSMAVRSDERNVLVDRDVASYYPRIILNLNLAPHHLGKAFLIVYRGLVDRRLEAKRLKNVAVSENLKIAVNGTFGKTGSPYSILYAPDVMVQILLGGQLYLLMKIERLEQAGIPVISANTDGCLMYCPRDMEQIMLNVVKEWEETTGFETEETRYKAVYARDVNAYMAIKEDNTIKGKNVYYDPWRANASARELYWRFQKNPTCQICVEAIEQLLLNNVPLDQTITKCSDITRFVAIKNVTGGAHWDGNYLGKVVRWYYGKEAKGTINYINSNRIVADTEGAVPLMDLPNEFPSDVDFDYYVQRAKGLLTDTGYKEYAR